MIYRLLISLLLFSPTVFADSLIIGGFSKHPEYQGQTFNEEHHAIGYEWNSFQVARYKNSYGRWSNSVSKVNKINADWGYRIGLADNYEEFGGIVPITQIIYDQERYEIGFGLVTTVIFKVKI